MLSVSLYWHKILLKHFLACHCDGAMTHLQWWASQNFFLVRKRKIANPIFVCRKFTANAKFEKSFAANANRKKISRKRKSANAKHWARILRPKAQTQNFCLPQTQNRKRKFFDRPQTQNRKRKFSIQTQIFWQSANANSQTQIPDNQTIWSSNFLGFRQLDPLIFRCK